MNGVTWKLVQRKNPQKIQKATCVFHIYINQEYSNVKVIRIYACNLFLWEFALFEGLNLKLLLKYLYIKMMTFFITFERYFTNGIMGNCLNDTTFSIVLESGIGTLWNIRLSHARARVSDARHARQGDRVYVVHGERLECTFYITAVNTFLTTTLVKSKNNPSYTYFVCNTINNCNKINNK